MFIRSVLQNAGRSMDEDNQLKRIYSQWVSKVPRLPYLCWTLQLVSEKIRSTNPIEVFMQVNSQDSR